MQADHNKVKRQLNIAKGQLEGIQRLIDNDAYCIDVSNQILATIAILKKTNNYIISEHLNHCIRNAKTDEELDIKIKEINQILDRMAK